MRMNLLEECKGAARIGISGHIRPDGDCVGSVLSLQMYLRKCLPAAKVKVFLEKPADIFSEIKGYDEIDSDFPEEEPFDVFFVLDCGADRIGEAEKYFRTAGKRINIDHHIREAGSGDVNCIDPGIGSTCELLYDLMDEDRFDRDIAMALYIGIIHDTGVFQYSNTTPETLRKGAKLIGYGFDFPRLIRETFYLKTYVQAQIMGKTLTESVRFLDNRCIVGLVDRETMETYHVGPKDMDGIVNQLKNIKGVECAVFLYQTGEKEYKVSLRSDEKVNAAQAAACFGGGGHARAAGCTVKGAFRDCVDALICRIAEQLQA